MDVLAQRSNPNRAFGIHKAKKNTRRMGATLAIARHSCFPQVPSSKPYRVHRMKKTPVTAVVPFMQPRGLFSCAALALAVLFLGLFLCVLGSANTGRAQQRADLTEDELAQLERGEMVVRRRTSQQDGMRLVGGATWLRIQAPPEEVFRALLNTSGYPSIFPACSDAKVLERHSEGQVVEFTHQQGPLVARYALRADIDEGRRDVSFVLDESRPHDIRAAWGYFVVHPYGENETILAYGVMADVGAGVVAGLLRREVQHWILRVPVTLRDFVQRERAQAFAAR